MKSIPILLALALGAGAALAAEEYETVVKDRTHGCKTPEETFRFWSMARENKEAAARYSNMKGCLMIPAGTPVVIVDRDPVAKMNGIRLKQGDDKKTYYVPSSDAN
jgi:hypothetical protein